MKLCVINKKTYSLCGAKLVIIFETPNNNKEFYTLGWVPAKGISSIIPPGIGPNSFFGNLRF